MQSKKLENSTAVILAKARIQYFQCVLDPGLRRGDVSGTFFVTVKLDVLSKKSIRRTRSNLTIFLH